MSGSADATCKIWDARTAQVKHTFECKNPVRTCGFSYSGNLAMYTTDSTLRENCYIIVRDLRLPEKSDPVKQVDITSMKLPKITSSIWGNLEDTIISGHETGEIMLWDMRKKGDLITKSRPHSKQVMDLQRDHQNTCFISASKDFTAKVFKIYRINFYLV